MIQRMMPLIFVLFAGCFGFARGLDEQVYMVDNLEMLLQELPCLDATTLVIFDISNVLVKHAIEYQAKIKNFLDPMKKTNFALLSGSFDKFLLPKEALVDQGTPVLIKKLQKQKVKVLALTSGTVGKVGIVEHYEDWRIAMLRALNIDLSREFALHSPASLPKFIRKGRCPLFKSGIIFATGSPKGPVLKAFFKLVGWLPRRIIFIDDSRDNLVSVQVIAQQLKIPFLGLHYTAAKKLFPIVKNEPEILGLEHI